jgi:hypothetical protein
MQHSQHTSCFSLLRKISCNFKRIHGIKTAIRKFPNSCRACWLDRPRSPDEDPRRVKKQPTTNLVFPKKKRRRKIGVAVLGEISPAGAPGPRGDRRLASRRLSTFEIAQQPMHLHVGRAGRKVGLPASGGSPSISPAAASALRFLRATTGLTHASRSRNPWLRILACGTAAFQPRLHGLLASFRSAPSRRSGR